MFTFGTKLIIIGALPERAGTAFAFAETGAEFGVVMLLASVLAYRSLKRLQPIS